MNAEVPMGPPSPAPPHDFLMIAMIMFVAIVAALILHYYLKTKVAPMINPDESDSDATARIPTPVRGPRVAPDPDRGRPTSYGTVPVSMPAAPPESSMYDVHLMREQDQALAQLAVQYEDMIKPPWTYTALANGIPDIAAGATPLGRRTQMLAAMSTPISAAGSQRGTSARQTLWFMNVGSNKVSATTKDACEATHKRINEAYFSITADRRKEVLQQIVSLTTTPEAVATVPTMHAACCGQTRVVFATQEEAEGMAEKLNLSYASIVKPEIDRVLGEIRSEASRGA